ncbi:nucleotidyltransferase domain-containing protein [Candidatus Collierbacteria bacterium]|nr:nucleotidyltransferase domain-containing protein [Candidatus Collierbacteria bacterium]
MELPGNKNHQRLLNFTLATFTKDRNVRSIILFGSLGRGDWDSDSDIDLDIIVKDDSDKIVSEEIKKLLDEFAKNHQKTLLHFNEAPHEITIVFATLDRMSIRFHLIEDTNWKILDSMKIIFGDLTKNDITRKLSPKKIGAHPNLELMQNKFLELAIYIPISLRREKLINAAFFLNKMRQLLIEIYANSRAVDRFLDFEKIADNSIIAALIPTYPILNKQLVNHSFHSLLTYYRDHFGSISVQKLSLTPNQKELIDQIIHKS